MGFQQLLFVLLTYRISDLFVDRVGLEESANETSTQGGWNDEGWPKDDCGSNYNGYLWRNVNQHLFEAKHAAHDSQRGITKNHPNERTSCHCCSFCSICLLHSR
jgi:hypothetical protein